VPDDRLRSRRESVNTRGRVPFVWVEDDTTGHRYDVPETAVRKGMTPVDGVEKNYGRRPRPTKHFVGKGGEPSTPGGSQPTATVTATATEDTPTGDPAAAENTPTGGTTSKTKAVKS
jgi:hypothetical protein